MEQVILRGEIPQHLYGSGDGYGDGYGYGYGDGSGYGSGSGYGYGSGDGYGSGSGSGDGYGSAEYWLSTIKYFSEKWSAEQKSRLVYLKEAGAKILFWKSNKNGQACNNGSNSPVKPGTVEKEKGPLPVSCGRGALHATAIPTKWQGERWWIVALIGEIKGDDEKYWALEREIIGECL